MISGIKYKGGRVGFFDPKTKTGINYSTDCIKLSTPDENPSPKKDY
jgi:hypothetical protein